MLRIRSKKRLAGVTLVETLLYVSIVGIFMVTVASMFAAVLAVRNKNTVVNEVNLQGVQIMQQITQALKNTSTLTAPAAGVTATSLTLTTYTPAANPTVFDLNSGKIRMSENGVVTSITSNRVTASSLSFQNMGSAGTKGSIKIRFTLTHVNPDNRGDLSYTQTFYDTITVK